MLEFVIISGFATMGVNKVCSLLLTKKAKDRGYVDKLYNRSQEKKGPVRKTVEILFNFIPGVNIIISAIVVAGTGYALISASDKNDEKVWGPDSKMDAFYTNSYYDDLDKKLVGLEDAMKLDGATPEIIKTEMKKAEDEVYSNHAKLSDDERRKLEAMSDTALWLRDFELENGLSYEERGELFPAYTKDFMNTKENAKPKAIQKTLKMVNNRSTK